MDFAIGPKLAAARKRVLLSLEEVAKRARVPADQLTALEEGEPVQLSTAALERIARSVDVDLSDLLGDVVHVSQPTLFFLQAGVPDFFETDRASVVSALNEAKAVAAIDELLERTYLRERFPTIEVGAVAFMQGYELAQRVRRALDMPSEPLGNMRELLEDRFGVPVLATTFHSADFSESTWLTSFRTFSSTRRTRTSTTGSISTATRLSRRRRSSNERKRLRPSCSFRNGA